MYRYAGVIEHATTGANTGQVRFTKAIGGVVNRQDNITQTVKANFFRSWTGMKFIVYNVPGPNNEIWVTLELWLCPSDLAADLLTNWTKVHSFIDKGNNFGTGGSACGGDEAQAITWGSFYVAMKYLAIPEVRWKKWSVREIDINGSFPTDPTDPPDEEPCVEQCPTGQHRDTNGNCVPDEVPPPTTATLNRFISWGDNDTTSDATDVLDRIFLETNVNQYLFAGDGPYSTSGDAWVDMMNGYFGIQNLKIN